MPPRNNIVVGVLAIVILAGAGAWYWQNQSKAVSAGSVVYEMKTLFENDEGGGVSYPYLSAGVAQPIIDSINQQIKTEIVDASCFGDLSDPEVAGNLRIDYLDQLESRNNTDIMGKSLSVTSVGIQTWSYETVRQHLIEDFGFWSAVSADVSYNAGSLLSLRVHYDYGCGGVHPSNGYFGMTFDLVTGKDIAFTDLFTNYARDKAEIEKIIFTYAAKVSPPDNGACDYLKDWEEGNISGDDILYSLNEKGLNTLSFGYPHVYAPCEPTRIDTTIPYSLLKPYLKETRPISNLGQQLEI